MKIIAFIAAILSAATVATLTFTTVPAIQKQAADNSAAIERNATEIEKNAGDIKDVNENVTSVDNSVDGLNTRLETLEGIKLYQHNIVITKGVTDSISVTILNKTNTKINTLTNLYNSLKSFAESKTTALNASGFVTDNSNIFYVWAIASNPNINNTVFVELCDNSERKTKVIDNTYTINDITLVKILL